MKQIESFFWGIIAALGALFIEFVVILLAAIFHPQTIVNQNTFFTLPAYIIIFAAIEEIFKYIVIAKKIDSFSLARNYITNSIFVGLGFFALEYVMIYFTNQSTAKDLTSIAKIALTHIFTSAIIGSIVALNNTKKISTFAKSVLVATFFHASYNLLLKNSDSISKGISLSLLLILAIIVILNFITLPKKLAS